MRPREGESEKSQYIQSLFCKETEAMKAATKRAIEIHPSMQIASYEGRILQVLLRTIGAKKGVEFGTFTGYSGVWIGNILGPEGKLYTLEYDPKHAELARKTFQEADLAKTVEVLEGPAQDNLSTLEENGPFDFVFIDADKGGYYDYLLWAENNVRKGGLIIGDNTFLFGDVFKDPKPENVTQKAWESMRNFNQRLADSSKYTSIILPTVEGMTVAVKEF